MKKNASFGVAAAILLSLGLAYAAGAATDIELFVLGKGHNFAQTGSETPSEVPDEPYNPIVFLDAASETSVQSVSITPPGEDEPVILQQFGTEWELPDEPVFQTKAKLDANMPNGDYHVEIVTANTGTIRENLTLSATEFPPVPRLKNYAALQAVNPDQNLTISWDAWPGGSASDVIRIEVEYADDTLYETMELDGTATSLDLPASLFTSGRMYDLSVIFIDVNDSFTLVRGEFPTGAAIFASSTRIKLQTTGELQPEFQPRFSSGNNGEFSMSPLVDGTTTGQPDYNTSWWHSLDLNVANQTEYPPAENVRITGPQGSGITNEHMDGMWQGDNESGYWIVFPYLAKPVSGEWTVLYDGTPYSFTADVGSLEDARRILVPTVTLDGNGNATRVDWTVHDPQSGALAALPADTQATIIRFYGSDWNQLWEGEAQASTSSMDINPNGPDIPWETVKRAELFTVYSDNSTQFSSGYAPTHGEVTDIAITDLSPSTTLATLGDTLQLTATVENRGTSRAEGITVLFRNLGMNYSIQALSLDPGSSDIVSASWTPVATGTYDQLTARLESADDDSTNDEAVAPPVQIIAPPPPLSDLLAEIDIYAGIEFGDPDIHTDTTYVFGIDISEAGENIQSITLQSPGTAPPITIRRDAFEESQLAGGQWVETGTWSEADEAFTEWEIEVYGNTDMENLFGPGTYALTAEFLDGTTQRTTLWFGEYTDQGEPAGTNLPTPTQEPVVSSPVNRAFIKPSEVTINLQAVTDPAVNAVHLEIENRSRGTQVLETLYPGRDAHTEILSFAEDGLYEISASNGAAFGFDTPITNADGIPVTGVRYTGTVLRVLVSAEPRIPLKAGWNLLGMFAETEMSLSQLLDDGSRASLARGDIYGWDRRITPFGGYKRADLEDSPEANKGYWILCDNAGATAEISGSLADNRRDLIQGWNLLAPSVPGDLPEHPDLVFPAWTWDADAQRYRKVADEDWLLPGMAYWLYARQPISDLPLTDED